jgi:AcrR family transcriptional regulator
MRERTSKADWLNAALRVLEEQGLERVTVSNLARGLGIARSGFYWHFRDRKQLLAELLEYWRYEFTEALENRLRDRGMSPAETLEWIARHVIEDELNRYDAQFMEWARRDSGVDKVVGEVVAWRVRIVAEQFEALGFDPAEADCRARIFHDAAVGPASNTHLPKRKVIELARHRVAFLIGPLD